MFNFSCSFPSKTVRFSLQKVFRDHQLKVTLYCKNKIPINGFIRVKEFSSTDHWFFLYDNNMKQHLFAIDEIRTMKIYPQNLHPVIRRS